MTQKELLNKLEFGIGGLESGIYLGIPENRKALNGIKCYKEKIEVTDRVANIYAEWLSNQENMQTRFLVTDEKGNKTIYTLQLTIEENEQ